MDEPLLQRMLGAFTHLARYPRELVSWRCSRVIHILRVCVCGGVTPRRVGWGCAACFSKPLLYLWPKSVIFPTLFITWPKIRPLFIYDLTLISKHSFSRVLHCDKTLQTFENTRLRLVFSTFPSCSQMQVVFYHSILHGLGFFIC